MNLRAAYLLLLVPRLLTFTPAAPSQSPVAVNFASAQQSSNGSSSFLDSPIAADLNGDGRMDFVAGFHNLYAYINNGDGTYRQILIDGETIINFAVADLDRDGHPDVLYSLFTTTGELLMIQHGLGDGTFGPRTSLTIVPPNSNYFITALTVGDFNNDGWPDVAIALGGTTNQVAIYLNQKNGTLAQGPAHGLAAAPGWIEVADLNNDGILDLATIIGYTVNIAWGTGTGTFTKGPTYSAGVGPFLITVGDINDDGFPDLLIPGYSGVIVLLGSSSGAFTPGATIHEPGARSVAVADFNGDGKLDVAVGTLNTNLREVASTYGDISYISVYPGNGSGTFSSHKIYGIGGNPIRLLAVDANGDGHLDLVTSENGLILFYGNGSGQFQASAVTLNWYATSMISSDFNKDGIPDLAVVNNPVCAAPCTGSVSIIPGVGKNYLGAPVTYPLGFHGAGIAVGDVNGDDIPDLVVTNNTANDTYDLAVLLGNANGTFQPAINQHLNALSADAVLADVNGDHKLDLVIDSGVALGNGNGTFGAIKTFPEIASAVITHIAVADFDKDGHPDVIVSTTNAPNVIGGGDEVHVLKGNGTGNFTDSDSTRPEFGNDPLIYAIAVADLNGDGYPDVVATGNQSANTTSDSLYVSVMWNHAGLFDLAADDTSNVYPIPGDGGYALALGDLNGDGKPDIAVAAHQGVVSDTFNDQVSVLLNNGKGGAIYVTGFNVGPTLITLDGPLPGITIGDYNHDGANDIAVTSYMGVSTLFNQAIVTLAPATLSWQKVSLGQTGAPKNIAVTNTSLFPVALHAAVGGSQAADFRIYSNTCNATIAAGSTCTVQIAFRPTATNARHAELTITQGTSVLASAPLAGIGAP
jgi:FG-GAP-like repeat/Cep192 domain 4/FG-GAP repeat